MQIPEQGLHKNVQSKFSSGKIVLLMLYNYLPGWQYNALLDSVVTLDAPFLSNG